VASTAVTRRLADVNSEPVCWLWPHRIARGKVTLIAGDPGLGKSQLTASLAARVSVGDCWPDGAAAPQGRVLILNGEDDAADTIRPRLEAAGADVSRIYVLDAVRTLDHDGRVIQRGFDLSRDIEVLRAAAKAIGEVLLIVIDPVSAYLGRTDSHRNADVRALLAPLSALAAELKAAILAVSHLNKGSGSDAIARVTGSLAFVAAARAAFLVVRDAQEPERRLFLAMKNNIGPDTGNGLAFSIEPATLKSSNIETSRLKWDATPLSITANEALAAFASPEDKGSKLAGAEAFLRDLLAAGPVPVKQIDGAALKAGHSQATVRRAKEKLKIVAEKEHFTRGWAWSLPGTMRKMVEGAQDSSVENNEQLEHLRDLGREETVADV
jgi:hypothetical protein